MANNRDDFAKPIIDAMAKRVAYLCSNPNCRKHTIGANEHNDKSTTIGIAAHITAASVGGPRYDGRLTFEQRTSIDNGIWLCSNCATLIDKDPKKYPVTLLQTWKKDTENESAIKLSSSYSDSQIGTPFLQVDLIFRMVGKIINGYSDKNPKEFIDGKYVIMVGGDKNPIAYWRLYWNYTLVVHNNSNFPAYNISIESIGTTHFTYLAKLRQINNIPPLKKNDLEARYEYNIECDNKTAEDIIKLKIPENFNDTKLAITYLDDKQNTHITHVEFSEKGTINKKIQ